MRLDEGAFDDAYLNDNISYVLYVDFGEDEEPRMLFEFKDLLPNDLSQDSFDSENDAKQAADNICKYIHENNLVDKYGDKLNGYHGIDVIEMIEGEDGFDSDLIYNTWEDRDDETLEEGIKQPIPGDYEILELPSFTKEFENLGCNQSDRDDLYQKLHERVAEASLGGQLYKFRWSPPSLNRGSANGDRIIYMEIVSKSKVFLVKIFAKNDIANISNKALDDIKKTTSTLQ